MSEASNPPSSWLRDLLDFLGELNERSLSWKLDSVRPDAVMVQVAVPGERWEVEFFADGSVEIEVFRSDGTITGRDSIERLLAF